MWVQQLSATCKEEMGKYSLWSQQGITKVVGEICSDIWFALLQAIPAQPSLWAGVT